MNLEERLALINKPPIEEITHFDLVNKPPIDELYHYGILGMKWGVRRFQNEDGSLTPLGQKRLAKMLSKKEKRLERRLNKIENKERKKQAKLEKRKAVIARDPELLRKNLSMFTNEEIENAYKRIEWDNKLADIRNSKIEKGKIKAEKLLAYGQTLNSALDFINSPIGRGIRGKMGLGTDKIFDYGITDAIAKKEAENELELQKKLKEKQYGLSNNKNPEDMSIDELEKLLKKKQNK